MAHKEQIEFISDSLQLIKKEFFKPDCLEIGSYQVNSNYSFRKIIGNCNYLGIDLIQGPGVDIVMDGENISNLNKKFDIIICGECFEHAENWQKIFKNMIENISKNGYLILTIASRGRLEHGTRRTNNFDSPGTGNYYCNLNKKDFYKNFDIDKIFESKFFYYNIHSHDLYVILSKNKSNSIDEIKNKYLNIPFKFPKLKNIKRFMISLIIGEKNFQNIRFLDKNLKLKFFKIKNKF